MNTVEIPTTDPQEILDQMSHLVGLDERRRFFERRPDLATVSLVEQACSEVVRQAKIDAERAIELAGSARYLADLVDDDSSRALAARAGANAHHFSGDYEAAQELYSEALGLFEPGKGSAAAENGDTALTGRIPVNTSGGLKSKGHPVGATGVSMHAMAYKHLMDEPIGQTREQGTPEVGVVLNVGGAAVSNCATVLRRSR